MDLINNRYRVLDVLYEKYYTNRYLVADAKLSNKKVCIDIFNKENMNSEILDYFENEFIKLKNANNRGIANIFAYGNIYSYDNIEKDDTIYFYLSEYIDETMDLKEKLDSMNLEQRLDTFAQVCCEINTLYLKGLYCNVESLDDIYILVQDNKPVVKIRDIVSMILDTWSKRPSSLNEKILIRNLRIIFNKLFKGYNGNETELSDLAAFITENKNESNVHSITEIINYINKKFSKEYKAFYLEELEKLNLKNVMVGRKDIKQHIIQEYQNIVNNKAGITKVIGIYGDSGSGKTRFMNEMIHSFSINRVKFFWDRTDMYIGEEGKTNNNFIKQLIDSVDNIYDNDYPMEINSLMAMFLNSDYGIFDSDNSNINDVYKFISIVYRILEEAAKKQPIVIMIDDIDLNHAIYKDILKYVISKNRINMLIIFSYKSMNAEMEEFLSFLENYENYENIKMQYLNESETVLMVKEVLSMVKTPTKISGRIYSYTYGNPLFIEEVIKNLFLTKKIYINKNGRWATDYNTIQDIPMPNSLKEAISSQIESMNDNELNVLKKISLFSIPVTIDILEKVFQIDFELLSIIDDIAEKGILTLTKTDSESLYEFSNKLMKNLIYHKLDENEKKLFHLKIADTLEKDIENNGFKYIDELIYHLEKINDNKRLLKYYVRNAVRLEEKGIYEGSIKYLEKVKQLFLKYSEDKRVLNVFLKLGDLYRRNGYIEKAQDYYKTCYEESCNINDTELQILALIKIATIYFNRNEIDVCDEYLSKAEKILEQHYYMQGEIEINIIKIKIYELRQEYLRAMELSNYTIRLCHGKMPKYMGRLLKHLGNINYYTGNISRALENYEESIRWYEKINYIKGTLNPLNSIGVIWGDYYQDDEKSLQYFLKMKKISQENMFLDSDILALINIGETYLINNDYEVAIKYLDEAREKCEKFSREADIFYNYIDIAYTYLKMEDYKNMFKYYKILCSELLEYPEQGMSLNDFYRFLSEMFLKMGVIEKAKYFSHLAVKRYGEDNSINKWNANLIKNLIDINENKSEEFIDRALNNIDEILDKHKSDARKAEIIYRTSYALHIKGYNEKSIELMKKHDFNTKEIKMLALGKYLRAVLYEKGDSIEALMESLQFCEKSKNKELQWRLCCKIGDWNYKRGNHFYAVNYYFQAMQVIKGLLYGIENKHKVDYYNSNGMNEPVYKVYSISVNMTKNAPIKVSRHGVSDINELDRLFKYENTKSLLGNRKLIRSAREIFDKKNANGIESYKQLLSSLQIDPIYNLSIIAKYMARILLAKQAYIIVEGYKKELKVIFTLDDNKDTVNKKDVIEMVRKTRREILITDAMLDQDKDALEGLDIDNKVIICIPVMVDMNVASARYKNERRNIKDKLIKNIGYVYFEADRIINNFNKTSLDKCNKLIPLVGLNIDKYVLKSNSSIDKLTRTFTRKYLEDTLEEQKYLCDSNETEFSIIMFDLDNFKHINDKYGHQAGDEALKNICSIVLNSIREVDCCGRYGGEEFIIVLPQTNLEKAAVVAEKIRNKIFKTRVLHNNHKATVSMGISSYPSQAHTVKELIEKADQALYVAKKMGRNRSRVWNESFKGKAKASSKLTGIITGNATQDYRNVSVMIEITELIKNNDKLENKLYTFLGRIIEVTESEFGSFVIINDNNVDKIYSRRMFKEGWQESEDSMFLIEETVRSGEGKYMIDWDTAYDKEIKNGVPDWKSIIVSPIINNGIIKAILILSAHSRNREFDFQDYNFVRILGQMSVGLL
ncbi:diguanylate cyclase [Clostridium oryzae]|uniref:Putative diguanylate cyclase YedQ n=1 Tax=Clostridium oryzae TaxID=1450648 RepID=A0A1V4ISY4_9CLOT|nr:diguanylate cyclase [Clostridium oryzae]OPJ63036.1 putative diguanylate cyclase YedQ [Clostridium oryzae]